MSYCNLRGVIRAAVVDNKPFHTAESRHFTRQLLQRNGQRLRLVEARYLDEEFHRFLQLFISETFASRSPPQTVRTDGAIHICFRQYYNISLGTINRNMIERTP